MSKSYERSKWLTYAVIGVILYIFFSDPATKETITDTKQTLVETYNSYDRPVDTPEKQEISENKTEISSDKPSNHEQKSETLYDNISEKEEALIIPAEEEEVITLDDNSVLGKAVNNLIVPAIEKTIKEELEKNNVIGEGAVVPGSYKLLEYHDNSSGERAICNSKLDVFYQILSPENENKLLLSGTETVVIGKDSTEKPISQLLKAIVKGMPEKSSKIINASALLLESLNLLTTEQQQLVNDYFTTTMLIEVRSVSRETAYANAGFFKDFTTISLNKESINCDDFVKISYEIHGLDGTLLSTSSKHGEMFFSMQDPSVPNGLILMALTASDGERKSAILGKTLLHNRMGKTYSKTIHSLPSLLQQYQQPVFVELTIHKSSFEERSSSL